MSIITVNPEIFTSVYALEITVGVALLIQEIKNMEKIKVQLNDRNVMHADVIFSDHRRLTPAHVNKRNAKIKGGELWKETFFNPP